MHVQSKGKEEAHGKWDAEYVVDTSPDEISSDDGEDFAGKVQGSDDVEEIRAHEDNVGSFDSD